MRQKYLHHHPHHLIVSKHPSFTFFSFVLVVKMMVLSRLSYLLAILTVVSGFVSPHSNRAFSVTPLAATATKSETMPEVKVGDKISAVTMVEGLGDFEKQDVNIAELIAGKKVVIFGVPGAFTPGCSKSHLPSFMEAQAGLKAKGVDMTICIATNDVHVMEVCTVHFKNWSVKKVEMMDVSE
jgi:hypothetical protein